MMEEMMENATYTYGYGERQKEIYLPRGQWEVEAGEAPAELQGGSGKHDFGSA